MTPEQFDLLLKARQSVSAAKVLLDNGYSDYAASRAYYSMFYVAEAFLIGQEMSFSSQDWYWENVLLKHALLHLRCES